MTFTALASIVLAAYAVVGSAGVWFLTRDWR